MSTRDGLCSCGLASSEQADMGLPESAALAGAMAGLDGFLEEVAGGFHWQVLDELGDGVYILDRERRIMYWSKGATTLTGYPASEALGRRCADNLLKHVDTDGNHLCVSHCPLQAVMRDGQPREAHVYLHHRDGHRVPVHVRGWPIRDMSGTIIGAFETFSDKSARTADLERIKALQDAAFCDALTGIANRRFGENALASRLAEFEREGMPFGLIVCDVDHFKQFNDRFGHDVGDEVLKMVARTLQCACRPYDLVARWGGEEFVVLAGSARAGVEQLASRMRALVEASALETAEQQLQVTISIGAAVARRGDDAKTLFTRADSCLYASKSNGRNCVTIDTEVAPETAKTGAASAGKS